MEWDKALSSWDRGMKFDKDFGVTHRKMIQTGEQLYFQHCTSCHGADGQGCKYLEPNNTLPLPWSTRNGFMETPDN